jgi:OOP family OmpA-OmpF porin
LTSSFNGFRLHAVGLAVLGATLGAPAMAQWAQGGYIGGNVGPTYSRFDNPPATTPPTALGIVSEDDREIGGKLYGGYQFHPNFAVEAGFFHLGSFDYSYSGLAGTVNGTSRYRGLNLDLVGTLPVTDRFSAFARVGAAYTRARTTFGGVGRTESDWGPKVGLGVEYAFTPQLSVRGEWERYRVDEPVRGRGNIDVASIGLVYRFGAPAPTRVVAPAPAPVIVTPAPAPRPVVVTPAPAPAVVIPAPAPAPVPAPAPAARPYRN